MGVKFYFIAFVLNVVVLNTMALKCKVCGTYECRPPPNNCPVGTVTDVCNCCLVCGKAENEICGGEWNLLGKCGEGLKCVEKPSSNNQFIASKAGICKKK